MSGFHLNERIETGNEHMNLGRERPRGCMEGSVG